MNDGGRQETADRGRWGLRMATMLVGGALAVGGLAAVAGPAGAAPSGCTTSWANGWTVTCTEGDGQYRAVVKCQKYGSLGRLLTTYEYGAWAAAGPDGYSRAWCDRTLGWIPRTGSIEFA